MYLIIALPYIKNRKGEIEVRNFKTSLCELEILIKVRNFKTSLCESRRHKINKDIEY